MLRIASRLSVSLRQHISHISGAGCYIYFLQAIIFPQTAVLKVFSLIDELFSNALSVSGVM
jgi:hypothetical protein